eukprot:m.137126 g.137126  ORF g.137126 m.137126 type:complete len:120 (-) comp9559_c2_seq8:63-422(-)
MASSAVSIGPPLPSLSHTHGSSSQGVSWTAVPWRASILIVVCRMVLVPAIGLGAVVLLRLAFPDFPPSMYLAMLMVTATPTANNIMVMAELAGAPHAPCAAPHPLPQIFKLASQSIEEM